MNKKIKKLILRKNRKNNKKNKKRFKIKNSIKLRQYKKISNNILNVRMNRYLN